MKLTDSMWDAALDRVVPKPIVARVNRPVTEDLINVMLTVSNYASFNITGEEMLKLNTPEAVANLLEARLRHALLALSEKLVETATIADEAIR